jgi:hypothetical protein
VNFDVKIALLENAIKINIRKNNSRKKYECIYKLENFSLEFRKIFESLEDIYTHL